MVQELYELPEGWEWYQLKDLCDFENGDRGKNYPSRVHFVNEGIPVISARALNGWEIEKEHINYITKERYDLIGSGKVKKGDLLFCLRGSLGKTALNKELEQGAIASSLVIVRAKQKVMSLYLLFYFNSGLSQSFIECYNNGAAQPNLSANNLAKFYIPIPSFEKQKHLVRRLETLFSYIDTAIAHLQHSLELNDQLFASSLNQAFNPLSSEVQPDGTYQLPEEWEWKSLSDIFEIARGGSPRPIKDFITENEEGVNWIKIGDAATGTKYISQTAEKIKPEGVSKSRMVYPGDFILSNSMSFGRPYIMQIEGCIHDGWLLLRPLSTSVSVDFMYQLLSSPFMYGQFSFAASGTTVKNLNSDIVRNSKVPVPNFKKQSEITERLGVVQAKTQENKQVLQQKLEQLQKLKASLLDSAFRGEL